MAIKGRTELGIAPDPRTGLEMTLLRMLAFRPAPEPGEQQQNPPPSQQSGGGSKVTSAAAAAAEAAALLSGGKIRTAPTQATAAAAPVSARQKRPVPASASAGITAPDTVEPSRQGVREALIKESALDEDAWLDLVETLEIKGPVRELARNLQFISAANSRWEFVIDHDLRHLATGEYLERLRSVIGEVAGKEIELRVTDSKDGVERTIAAIEQSRRRTQLTEAERSIEEDPTVMALKKNLGARVIEDSIQPVQ